MNNYHHKKPAIFRKGPELSFAFFLLSVTVLGEVRLPALISDGMVLQRDTPVKISSWAGKYEKVTLSFYDSIYYTSADDKGEWMITLSALRAGGPFTMTINASNMLVINNIMVGEVWICSGQSNLELSMQWVSPLYETEITNSSIPFIRHFTVPQRYDFNTLQAKGGELKYFAIAGPDRRFVWVKAIMEHYRVIVWNEAVPDPVAVRYAWADNPEGANLYNLEGLPASPFRTNDY